MTQAFDRGCHVETKKVAMQLEKHDPRTSHGVMSLEHVGTRQNDDKPCD
jgi:hypothetical protein